MKISDIKEKPELHDRQEIKDLIFSAIILGIAFNTALLGGGDTFGYLGSFDFFVYLVPVSLMVLGSLVIKEFFQKFLARNWESHLKYEMWVPGSIIAFLSSLIGFVIASAGGVKITTDHRERYGRWVVNLSSLQLGLLSLQGISVYLLVAILGFMFAPAVSWTIRGTNVFMLLTEMNVFLAIFSLPPLEPLDGENIFRWNVIMWLMMVFVCVLILFII